ncbi:hypothetical protein EGW08_007854 [Elysia chlorotica]|uniref:Pre-rRNA-processing protein RIX1 N-terminal domain-containing protein n=1 Tax=Elysia chlorotica TaxID=188477 RepID=A0A3S1A765_ELYCH|nr:hypothetical protein EGW08_007854 [Elysia chlorotica]
MVLKVCEKMAVPINHLPEDFMAPRKAEEWNKYAHKLTKLMTETLSVLYENLENISEPPIGKVHDLKDDRMELDDVPLPDVVATFVKHCDSLEILLRTPSKWPIKLPMKSIIGVLNRCLRVTSADLKFKPSFKELADSLPTLHKSALSVMAELIVCCGSNVLPVSRVIIDACLRSLAGTMQAKIETRSTTREKIFQVLSLMVGRFGWSRYLQSVSHSLIQDLMADICTQEAPKTNLSTTPTRPKQEVESIALRKSKKRKKGKKQKGDSYSDLPVFISDETEISTQREWFNVEATRGALELSQLIIQRAEFSQVQTLIRSLLSTCKNLQREGPAATSPYNSMDCRKGLYSAVFSSATVRLGYDCDRKDTINHYQATNLAMSLLNAASHSDTSLEIRKNCLDFLVLLRNTGNLNRPIVRRILPDEQMNTKDITEVELEAEKIKGENKSLWQQLVDSQMEVEAQRRELRQLREAASHTKTPTAINQVEHGAREKSADNNNDFDTVNPINGNSADSSDEENEESSKDDDKDVCSERRDMSPESKSRDAVLSGSKGDEGNSSASSHVSSPSKNLSQKQSDSSLTSDTAKQAKNKRPLGERDGEEGRKKKPKTSEPKTESADIDDMLSDFVDTGPDKH